MADKAIESGRSAARSYTRVEGMPTDFARQVAADNAASAAATEDRLKRLRARDTAVADIIPPEVRQAVADTKTRALEDAAIAKMRYAKGGKVGSASKRADGIAQRGKTRGTMR